MSNLNVPRCPPNYVPGQVVEIDRINAYGFQGRDCHPHQSDLGKLALVKVVELGSDYQRELRTGDPLDEDYVMLTCEVIGEERVLELLAEEVLIVSDPA